MLTNFIAVILSLIIASCANNPLKPEEVKGSFDKNVDHLNLNQSFAFYSGKDEYYFSRTLIENGDSKCIFFIGFKNNQFKYSFPAYRLTDLSKVYYANLSLRDKKNLVLQKLDNFAIEPQRCSEEIAIRETSASEVIEAALTLLVFAPAIPLGMIFGIDVYVESIKDSVLTKRLNQLRLGMTKNGIEKLLDRKLTINKTSQYEYFTLDTKYTRIAMDFEKGRLSGFVRGYKDKLQHEQ